MVVVGILVLLAGVLSCSGCGGGSGPLPRHGLVFAHGASVTAEYDDALVEAGSGGGGLYLWRPRRRLERLASAALLRDQPDWSPNGKLVAFTSTLCNDDPECTAFPEVFVARSDGSDQRRLTFPGGADELRSTDPSWSPDSRRIAFATQFLPDFDSRLGIVSVTGGKIAWLRVSGWQPAWGKPGIAYLVQRRIRVPSDTDGYEYILAYTAIRLVNPSKRRSTTFASPPTGYHFESIAWSSRGELAAVDTGGSSSHRPTQLVATYSATGRRLSQFGVPEALRTCGLTWTPEGADLLLTVFPARDARKRIGRAYPQLYTVDPSGEHWRRLSLGLGLTSCHVSWR